MISILKITKGNNSAKNVGEQLLLISACRLVMLYICAKFSEIIWNGIKAIEWTQFLYGKLQRIIIPPKMQVEGLLLISAYRLVMLYISTKFHEIILNGIKVIDRADMISILKITKGNNSAKKVGGVTFVYLCMLYGHALYFYHVL